LVVVATVFSLVAPAAAVDPIAQARSSARAATAVSPLEAKAAYARLPLSFVPNRGQADKAVLYAANAGSFAVQFTRTEARFAFSRDQRGHVRRLRFVGANAAATVVGSRPATGTVNYLLGSDPAKWHTGLPTFGEVIYRDLWPGIDLAFRGEGGTLKYEFYAKPGADRSAIRLSYVSADGLPIDDGITQLGVEPGVSYSTFVGGSSYDSASAIAVDAAGSAYITGQTSSPDFATPGAYDTTLGQGPYDAYVTKIDPAGTSLVYSTYVGGIGWEWGRGIAVDASGHAHVTGMATDHNFPTTAGAYDRTAGDGYDAFVFKLNPSGTALVYSTYLGGDGYEYGSGIAQSRSTPPPMRTWVVRPRLQTFPRRPARSTTPSAATAMTSSSPSSIRRARRCSTPPSLAAPATTKVAGWPWTPPAASTSRA
jgi:hypothetical protein